MEPYQGKRLRVELTDDAKESFIEATSYVPPNKDACTAQLIGLIRRLADFGRLRSPEQMNNEESGFYAIRARCGLRAYGWYHTKIRGVFVISHFIMKKKNTWHELSRETLKRPKAIVVI